MAQDLTKSIGEQITQLICDALDSGVSKPCPFERTRLNPVRPPDLPHVAVYGRRVLPERLSPTQFKRTLTLRLEITVKGKPPIDSKTDPIYLYAVRTFYGQYNALRELGMQTMHESDLQWETEQSYTDACVAVCDLEVVFKTTNDPAVGVQ